MTESSDRTFEPAPRAFQRYAALLVPAAAGAAVAAAAVWPAAVSGQPAKLWALAAFVLAGELLPIRIPHGTHVEEVTTSTAFAVAFIVLFGALPAIAVYAGTCLAADLIRRTELTKSLFNVSQSVLSLAAAAAVLAWLSGSHPGTPAGTEPLVTLAAAGAFFLADSLLAHIGFVFLTGVALGRHLRQDAASPLTWTSGFMVTLAPLVVAGAQRSSWLVPLLLGPTLATYLAGRHALRSAHRALHDELTGLPNRAMLYERLEELLEESERVVVLLLDIDDFRAVNDTLGHQHGDAFLGALGERLETALAAEAELVARVGGDEFAILFTATGAEPDAVAKRTAEILAAPFSIDGLALEAHTRFGAACFPEHGDHARELVRRADIALHRARSERTLYDVYRPEYDQFSVDRLLLAGQLRRAVAGGELVVHYQPKFSLATGRPHAAEALVRWAHPELGLLGPQAFVPLAEHTGLVGELTEVVLDQALAQCASWRAAGLELVVAVNLSPRSLLDSDLPRRVGELLERHRLAGSMLQIEITETGVVLDVDGARRVLDELHRLGVGCAIDDFGTGYSSLTQLKRLNVDEIKIDRSFVEALDRTPDDEAIVRSTIELGRSLGLAVTAEGVESEAIWRRLRELNCDYAQGFHVGHPLPGPAFTRAFAPRRAEAARA